MTVIRRFQKICVAKKVPDDGERKSVLEFSRRVCSKMLGTPVQGRNAVRGVPAPIKGDPTCGSGPV